MFHNWLPKVSGARGERHKKTFSRYRRRQSMRSVVVAEGPTVAKEVIIRCVKSLFSFLCQRQQGGGDAARDFFSLLPFFYSSSTMPLLSQPMLVLRFAPARQQRRQRKRREFIQTRGQSAADQPRLCSLLPSFPF